MFYLYSQNNSGGGFKADENLDEYVVIEAPDSEMAQEIALKLGVYLDGVDLGVDCECCGDRWSSWCEESEELVFYGDRLNVRTIEELPSHNGIVHYLDGTKGYFKE